MTRKFHTRMIVGAVAFGAALSAAGMLLSGAAKADSADYARVEVYWAGTPCIDILQATGVRQTVCGGSATFTAVTGPGRTIGIDPIMGAASSISCLFYLNGTLDYVDLAYAGDGTDVNCIRSLYIEPVQNGMYV